MQARQIFVFAEAAATGLYAPGLVCAQEAFGFLESHAWDRGAGGWFHRLSYGGTPLERTKDCYDHAFVLLALAALTRAGGSSRAYQRAVETADFLDAALGQTQAGAFDGYAEQQVAAGAPLPLPRRQNPHMHLLEAFLALHEASGEGQWLVHARKVLALFERHFFKDGQLVEFFDGDWREVPQDGRSVREPGHFFEWVWLLQRYATLSGDAAAADAMRPLYDWAWQNGVDRESAAPDVVFEEVDPAGRILAGGSKRLWPQCEAVKAALAMHARFGEDQYLDHARRLLGGLFTTFASLARPDWREQVDRDGNVIRAGMPSSSLYHLYMAAAEAVRVLA